MLSDKRKLRLLVAVAALVTLALAVSCTGFFQNPTLQTISLQPPTPTISVGGTPVQMQAWGTDSDNNRSELTSNVSWEITSVTATNGGAVATISASGLLSPVSAGTATVQASSEGISGTTTATVVEIVTSMSITPTTGQIPDDGTTSANFQVFGVIQGGNGAETDITSLVTLTAEQNGSAVSGITCTYSSTADQQQCIAESSLDITTDTTYSLVVTYGGYSGTPVSATLTVTPAP